MTEKRTVTVYSDETKLRAMQAVAAGQPIHEAARENEVNPSTLVHWLRAEAKKSNGQMQLPAIAARSKSTPAVHKGPKGRNVYSSEYKQAIAARIRAGDSAKTIAEETGINVSMLQKWKNGFGLSNAGGKRHRKTGKRIGRPPNASLPAAPEAKPIAGPRGELQDVRSFLKNAIDEYRTDAEYSFLLMQLAYKHLLRALGVKK